MLRSPVAGEKTPRTRVLHIVPDLRTGGAETMLVRLINSGNQSEFEHQILSLRSKGDFDAILEQASIQVDTLGIRGWLDGLLKLRSIRRIIRSFRPHIVHTWLYHANVIGGVAAIMWSDANIVWGLHSGWLAISHTKRLTRIMRAIGAQLSGWVPDDIICCAHSVREFHAGLGYASDKLTIVPNGVELDRFHPDEFARRKLRSEWEVSPSQTLVGMVARFDPQKDFRTFLDAAAIVRGYQPNARFVLCGPGFEASNETLIQELKGRNLHQHVILLGFRSDIPRVMAALDIFVLSSLYGEALPLVVIEAMACGVPVVASDIGDIQRAIGRWGKAVQTRSPQQFAEAVLHYIRLSEEERRSVATNARDRVATMFPLSSAVDQHEALYRHVLGLAPKSDMMEESVSSGDPIRRAGDLA
jgi:glycosyltransferase involved in cell wall biosynthesis